MFVRRRAADVGVRVQRGEFDVSWGNSEHRHLEEAMTKGGEEEESRC